MRPTYAATLDLAGEPLRAFTAARALMRRWVVDAVGGWPPDADPLEGSFTVDATHVRARYDDLGQGRLWQVRLRTPAHHDPTLAEVTEVAAATDGVRTLVHVITGLTSTTDRLVGTVRYDVVTPTLVADIVDRLDVRDAGVELKLQAHRLCEDDLPAFEAYMSAPSRRLPVIVIGGGTHGCDPDLIADALAGLAHVAVIVPDALGHWRRLMPAAAVRAGEVRLCWAPPPGGGRATTQLWEPDQVRPGRYETFEYRTARTLNAVAAFRTPQPALITNLAQQALRRRSAARSTETPQASTPTDTAAELPEVIEAWEADLLRAEAAEARSEELAKRVERAEAELELVRTELEWVSTPSSLHPPVTMTETVTRAATTCVHLEFHPDAFTSAEECAYQRPDLVYDDLVRLDEVVGRWRADGLPAGLVAACREVGIDWRNDVSTTARSRYASDYEHTIDGEVRFCGAHFGRGKNTPPTGHVRIHCYVDAPARRIVVVYLGRHLRDASNR